MAKKDYLISQVGSLPEGKRRVILLLHSSEQTAKRHACRLARRGHLKTSIKILEED